MLGVGEVVLPAKGLNAKGQSHAYVLRVDGTTALSSVTSG